MNINNISLQGLQNSQNNVIEASKKIADSDNIDKTKPLIDLKQEELNFKANAKALQTSNDMIGTIINIEA